MTQLEELIISCLKENDSRTLSVIQKEWLEGKEKRQYLKVMDYFRSEGELMGVKSFCSTYHLSEYDVDAKPSFYLKQLRERYIFTQISDKVPRILTGVKDNPREKLEQLQELVGTLASDTTCNNDVLYSTDPDKRIEAYNERMKSLGVTYLSMGCEDMDRLFFGYGREDLITIGGKAGQGKTWVICYLTYLLDRVITEYETAHETKLGDILFISNEMSKDEIIERLDCIRFHLPYQKFLSGTLSDGELKMYKKGLRRLKRHRSHIRIIYSCMTIDDLAVNLGLYQPSAVFVDGSYLMEPKLPEGWEKITYVTRNLKRLAKGFRCPIINTTQLKRKTGTKSSGSSLDGLDDFAYSTSFGQDSDIAIRMYQDADMKFHDVVALEVAKGRRVVSGTTILFENNLDKMLQSLTVPVPDESTIAEKIDL